jgi:hypothetical protein
MTSYLKFWLTMEQRAWICVPTLFHIEPVQVIKSAKENPRALGS